jgi:hypothetical protein
MSQSPNRLLATVLGVIYLVIAILGFIATASVGFFAIHGGLLLGIFQVNAFQNVLHVVIGAALLLAAFSNMRAAKTVNTVVGLVCLVLGIVGLFIVDTDANILALNAPDHVLHFGTAVVLLGVGLGADRRDAPVT